MTFPTNIPKSYFYNTPSTGNNKLDVEIDPNINYSFVSQYTDVSSLPIANTVPIGESRIVNGETWISDGVTDQAAPAGWTIVAGDTTQTIKQYTKITAPSASTVGAGNSIVVDGVTLYSNGSLFTPVAAKQPLGARVLLMGDSLTARNGEGFGKNWNLNGVQEFSMNAVTGMFTLFNTLCGSPFRVIHNGGISGQKSDEIAARFDAEWDAAVAKAGGVDVVNILAGTNDLGVSGYTASTTYASILEMMNKSLQRGSFVLVWGIPPKNSLSTASVLHKMQVNQLLKDFCRKTPNTYYINSDLYLSDNTVTTGAWKTGYAVDGTHPDTYVAMYNFGKSGHDYIKAKFNPYSLISSASDTRTGYGISTAPFADGLNIFTNTQSLCSGTGTATPGTAVIVGTPPSGWTLQTAGAGLTVTCSQEARSDGVGNDAVFSCNIASGTGHTFELYYQSTALITAGKWYEFSAEIQLVSGETIISRLYNEVNAATGSSSYVRNLDYSNIVSNSPQASSPLLFTTVLPRFPIQTGEQMRIKALVMTFSGTPGTAVIKIGRISCREYSSQY